MDLRKQRIFLLFLVFLDLMAVGMVIPLIPYIVDSLGGGPKLYGLLGSLYGALQMIGGPTVGHLSDKHSRSLLLSLSFFASALSYTIMGMATSVVVLVLSRIPVGLFKQTVTLSQALMTDLTGEEDRTMYIAFISSAVDLGFVVGPSLASLLTYTLSSSPSSPSPSSLTSLLCFAAGFIYLLNIFLLNTFLHPPTKKKNISIPPPSPNSLSPSSPSPSSPPLSSSSSFLSFLPSWGAAWGGGGGLVGIYFFSLLSQMLFTLFFPKYTQMRYDVPVVLNGLLQSYLSCLSVLTQAIGVPYLIKNTEESNLIFLSSVSLSVSLLALSLAPSLSLFIVVLVPFACSCGVLNTCMVSQLTKTDENNVGALLGVAAVGESLARFLAPALAGVLVSYFGPSFLPLLGGILMGGVVAAVAQKF